MGEARQTRDKGKKLYDKTKKQVKRTYDATRENVGNFGESIVELDAKKFAESGMGIGADWVSLGQYSAKKAKDAEDIVQGIERDSRADSAVRDRRNRNAENALETDVNLLSQGYRNTMTGKQLQLLQGSKSDKAKRLLDVFNSRQQDIERRSLLTTTR